MYKSLLKKYSKKDLANTLGVSEVTVGRWVSGKNNPSASEVSIMQTLLKLNSFDRTQYIALLNGYPVDLSWLKKHSYVLAKYGRFSMLSSLLVNYYSDNDIKDNEDSNTGSLRMLHYSIEER